LKDLDTRRESIIKSVEEQEKMTPELLQKIRDAMTMAELEVFTFLSGRREEQRQQ
jgi:uncharacterized protein